MRLQDYIDATVSTAAGTEDWRILTTNTVPWPATKRQEVLQICQQAGINIVEGKTLYENYPRYFLRPQRSFRW